jgi:hypothetical protein
MIPKKYLAGVLYAALNPVQVWTGYELGRSDFLVAFVLVALLMAIEGFAVVVWMDAQTADIKDTGSR